jgi:S-adenosylmethionine:tRNA ribosyltransferase-isomerase
MLLLNNTKVIPARLLGVKKDTLGKVDVLLAQRLTDKRFRVLIKPNLKIGGELIFCHGTIRAQLVEDKVLEFQDALSAGILEKIGLMPLPHYIRRQPEEQDSLRYQTVYAKNPGAIAAPTAGLHFTRELLNEIEEKGVRLAHITLHVGVGTFKPVRSEDIRNHIMEPEKFNVSQKTIKDTIAIKEKGGRVFAVGTTTARALEASSESILNYPASSIQHPASRRYTNLFIYPGYDFKVADCLLTNFHLPKTTLLMLVCAFAGKGLIMQAYQEAIKEKYRFYSYGDAMLII